MQVVGAALMADVSNSTPLYEQQGEQSALREISACLDELRAQIQDLDGVFLHSKGDDVLAFFEDADAALETAKRATVRTTQNALKVHAGLSWGPMLMQTSDMHGTPVNIASRLASLAKPHEVLVYETLYRELSVPARGTLHEVDALSLKGSRDRLTVYSHVADDRSGQTVEFTATPVTANEVLTVVITHLGTTKELTEGEELSLGRAVEADITISQPWVSRLHASVSVIDGIVVLRDHSTLGSFVQMDEGREILTRRGGVTLIGNGKISLGAPFAKSDQAIIEFLLFRSPIEQAPQT